MTADGKLRSLVAEVKRIECGARIDACAQSYDLLCWRKSGEPTCAGSTLLLN